MEEQQMNDDDSFIDGNIEENGGENIVVQLDGLQLHGNIKLPSKQTKGIVIFAHGSGSSRFSPRNRYVASELNKKGLGTLLFDLLTTEEEISDQQTGEYRFNIPLLAQRLSRTTQWLKRQPQYKSLPLGYFGSSTGAAAALIAAADQSDVVRAIVSRSGRPDLAGDALSRVKAPTLLVVGEWDDTVIELNHQAQTELYCENQLKIVSGATHLFEEPGTLDEVTRLAGEWFRRYLA